MTDDEALAWAHANLPTDPDVVMRAMFAAGWVTVGYRTGVYVRLARPDDDRRSLTVPLNPEYGDYPDLMAAVLAELALAADAGRRAQQVLDGLTCHAPPGRDCPDRARAPRQVRRALKRELDEMAVEAADERRGRR